MVEGGRTKHIWFDRLHLKYEKKLVLLFALKYVETFANPIINL